MLTVSEHITKFLQMIRWFQSHETNISLYRCSVHSSCISLRCILVLHVNSIIWNVLPILTTTTFLTQVRKISRNNETKISDSIPHIEFHPIFFWTFNAFNLTQLWADNLQKDFIFLEKCWLKLKHRCYSFRDWINTTQLISNNVVVLFTDRLYQTNVLNIIF